MAKSAVLFWPIYGFLDTLYVDISSYYDFISCMWCISMFLLFWTWPLIELWGHRRPLNISVAWKRRSTDRYIKYIIYYIYNIYILLYILYYSVLIFVFCFLNMLFWGFKKNLARFWRWANCPCCYYRDQQDNLANAKIEPISIWIFWNFFYWPISSYWSCSILCIVIKVYQSTLSMKKILGNTKRWKKMDQNLRFEVKITQNMSNVA